MVEVVVVVVVVGPLEVDVVETSLVDVVVVSGVRVDWEVNSEESLIRFDPLVSITS